MQAFSPREIVSELDRFIIGQDDAKKSVGLSILYKVNVIMLIMLTPEIKTNLILKEIGIKRYSLRSSNDQSQKKSLHFYKKGHILALLDKPYENFVREQQDLLTAIFSSTKIDNGEEVFKSIRYSSNNDLRSEFEEMNGSTEIRVGTG